MTASEQILEFIDGTLEPIEEQHLFNEMVARPELRSELRQLIAIGDAVRSDREAFAPPADVERALLAGLGIGLIGTGTVSAVSAGGGVLAMLKGLLPIIASFAVGAAVAGGGVYLAFHGSSDDRSAAPARTVAAAEPGVPTVVRPGTLGEGSAAASNRPVASVAPAAGTQTARAASGVSGRTTAGVRTPALLPAGADVDRAAAARAAGTSPSPIITSSSIVTTPAPRALEFEEPASAAVARDELGSRAGLPSPPAISATLPDISGLTVGVRSLPVGFAFVDNNAREVDAQLGDESAVWLGYRSAYDTWVSLDVGRSRYTQVLMVDAPNDENGGERYSRIEQEPNVTWIGLSMKRTLDDDLLGIAQPFWQGTLAYGLQNGPMVRGRFGLLYELFGGLAVTGAIDASTLVYMYNGQPLVTGKYGLSFGAEFGF